VYITPKAGIKYGDISGGEGPKTGVYCTQEEEDVQISGQQHLGIPVGSISLRHVALVAELVDAHDSKSCAFGRGGSIPSWGTLREFFSKLEEFPFLFSAETLAR
jgi:hypothetical protein